MHREHTMSSDKSTSNNPQMRKFIDVQKALKGASYPASKEDLLETAKQNGADQKVLKALDAMTDSEVRQSGCGLQGGWQRGVDAHRRHAGDTRNCS
jgi:hypothetical protein